MTSAKFYVPVVTLSAQDYAKLLQQLHSGFKRTTNSQNQLKIKNLTAENRNLDQGVNRLFVLSIENEDDRTRQIRYSLPKVEIRDYNVKIDGRNVFDQPINDDIRTYENIRKIPTGR